jgi:ComF family protein
MRYGSGAFLYRCLKRLGWAFQTALFPHRCFRCNTFYFPSHQNNFLFDRAKASGGRDYFKALLTPFFCQQCRHSITLLKSPFCRICGLPFEGKEEVNHTCGTCIQTPKRFDLARSCGVYSDGLKDLIHCFKYGHIPQLAKPLGVLLAWGFLKYFQDRAIDMIIPVPLHPKRMRSRGFNQAYLLIQAALKEWLNKEYDRQLPDIATKKLVRIRATQPQTGLGRDLRWKNIRNAFAVTPFSSISNKSVLLVDDVYTTGATVDECARVLKKGGAGRVDVLSLARAV